MCKFCSKPGPFHCSLCLTVNVHFVPNVLVKRSNVNYISVLTLISVFLSGPPQKKRCKSQCKFRKWPNKACERCFLCRSVSFCPSCDKCPHCCRRSACGVQTTKILASLGPEGFESRGGLDSEGGIQPSVQDQASSHQDTSDKERICLSPQGPLPAGGIAFPPSKTSYRKGKGTNLSSLLQQTLHCPKTKSKMVANFGPQCLKLFRQGQNLQNGNTRVHSTVPASRRVGHVARLQRGLLSHPYQSKLKEVPPVPLSGPNLPVWPLYSSYGVYHCGQEGKAHGSGEKYPNAPVPGRLVDSSKRQSYLFPGHPNPSGFVPRVRLGSEPQEIRAGTQAEVGSPELQNQFSPIQDQLFSEATHVLDRPPQEKQVPSGRLHMRPIQWLLKNHWHIPESLEKIILIGRSLHPHLLWWVRKKRPARPAPAPPSSHGSDLYRRIKRRLGHTFRRLYRKGWLVCSRKQAAYQLSGIKGSLVGPQGV